MNVGEEICGEWLRHIKHCDFIQYNLQTLTTQGEIDVIGINVHERILYVCEVATHLGGLQYVKDGQPNNVDKLTAKFRTDITYARDAFPDHAHVFMLWTPAVKIPQKATKHNQFRDVENIVANIQQEFGATLQPVINDAYQSALDELRAVAGRETKALESSVMRYLQVEEHLAVHLRRLRKRKT